VKLYPDSLDSALQKRLLPLYIVSGDEVLRVEESADCIRRAARHQGFEEREVFHADSAGFSWEALWQSLDSLSLFASRKLVELRCSKKQLLQNEFLRCWEKPNPDTLVLVITEKLDKAALSGKAFATLDRIAGHVAVWPLESRELPRWLDQRARQQGLSLEPAARDLLLERTEGHLLATAQELEKLHLQFGEATITVDMLDHAVSDSARFDVFKLTDSLLRGDARQSLNIFHHLVEEGETAFTLLRTLVRELHVLTQARQAIDNGQSLSQALNAQRIWEKRHGLYQSALQRLSLRQLHQLLQRAERTDLAVMGLARQNIENALVSLCLAICGIAMPEDSITANGS